ncbi:MAG: transposase [bacterium]
MVRFARIVVPGVAYHVTQRGNNRQDVFFVDSDRRTYLMYLGQECGKYGLEVHGYCLMTNHIHLIVVPPTEDSLAHALGRTHFRYTQYINRLHRRIGHLWQSRFFSCPLDENHYYAAMKYVERNPVRSRMVRKAWNYRWSSAGAHTGGEDETGFLHTQEWEGIMLTEDWREELSSADDAGAMENLRVRTRTGRPLGSDSFISKLEVRLGRRLRPLPVGRPKKKKTRGNK